MTTVMNTGNNSLPFTKILVSQLGNDIFTGKCRNNVSMGQNSSKVGKGEIVKLGKSLGISSDDLSYRPLQKSRTSGIPRLAMKH